MSQNIITYLNENKEKYSKEALVVELRKTGYAEGDIAEGVAQVFGGAVPAIVSAKTSFWNFKDKKVYTNAGQKWADFLFGFFVATLLGPVLLLISLFLIGGDYFLEDLGYIAFFTKLSVSLFCVFAAIYLFSRRRSMFYGVATSFFSSVLFLISW